MNKRSGNAVLRSASWRVRGGFFLLLVSTCFPVAAEMPLPSWDVESITSLMPENATAGLFVPPLPALLTQGLAFVNRFVAPDARAETLGAEWLQRFLPEISSLDAAFLSGFLVAKGIDPAAPLAFFVSMDPVAAEAAKVAGECAKEGYGGTGAAGARLPAVVGVFPSSNSESAENSLCNLLAALNPAFQQKPERRDLGKHAVYWFGNVLCYCVTGPRVFVANEEKLLQETLARFESPDIATRGLETRSPNASREIVLLTRVEKAMALAPDLAPVFRYAQPIFAREAEARAKAYARFGEAYAGDGPLLTTVTLSGGGLEVVSRLNMKKHPKLAVQPEELKPLRLTGVLSQENLLNVSVRSTAPFRRFVEDLYDSLPEIGRIREVRRAFEIGGKVLAEEVAASVEIDNGANFYCVARIDDPEAFKATLKECSPELGLEETQGDIWRIKSLPGEWSILLRDGLLALASDGRRCDALLERAKAGTLFMESLIPPLQSSSTLVLFALNAGKIQNAFPILFSGMPQEELRVPIRIADTIREIRVGKVVKGDWQKAFLSVHLK